MDYNTVYLLGYLPLLALFLWRGTAPFLLCRDVEKGIVARSTLVYVALEAGWYIVLSLVLVVTMQWSGMLVILLLMAAMFLTGIAGVIRTAIAYFRTRNSPPTARNGLG